MIADSIRTTVGRLDRIHLRRVGDAFGVVDTAYAERPGKVARNPRIADAVEDRLARVGAALALRDDGRGAHG